MQRTIALLGTGLLGFAAAAVDFNVSALVAETIESDWTTTYYSQDSPLLVGNDGGASTGGFHAWNLNADEPLTAVESVFAGRTKLVSTLYNIAGKDYLVSISQTTSRISLYELPDVSKGDGAGYFALGDWAALCSWKSQSKNDYLFLFGKREAIQFLVRSNDESGVAILRVGISQLKLRECANEARSKLFHFLSSSRAAQYLMPLHSSFSYLTTARRSISSISRRRPRRQSWMFLENWKIR
jgi:3-phytase